MRFDRSRLGLLLPLGALLVASAIHAAGPGDTGDAFLVLRVETAAEIRAFVDEWNAAGARLVHIYPPDVVIGDVPAPLEERMRADRRVAEIHRKPARVSGYGKAADRRALIARSWNDERVPPGRDPSTAAAPVGDLLLPPAMAAVTAPKAADGGPARYGRVYGANEFQTSEVFLGKIAVGVILPDSPGAPYTQSDEENVLAAVRGAMDWWSGVVGYIGVQFVYDIHARVPCSRVFTNADPRNDEAGWMHEIMANLGYPALSGAAAWDPVYDYVNGLRESLGTEWGVCMFIPNAPSFTGCLSYERIGGPYCVTPSGTQKYGYRSLPNDIWLSHLLIHEMGHLFWALDEHSIGQSGLFGPAVACASRSGYSNTYNTNSLYTDHTCVGAAHFPCCMVEPGANVCGYTLGHMGLGDTDDDGVPDVADTDPSIAVDPLPDTVTVVDPWITGVAAEEPAYNHIKRNGVKSPDITFQTIEHVLYRIDQMTDANGLPLWLSADPEGGFDDADPTNVPFSFRPDSLYAGRHRVTIRAVNSAQNRTGTNNPDATIDVYVKAVALHDFAAEPDFDGRVRLSYRIRGAAFGAEATVYRTYEGGSEEVFARFPLEDESRKEFFDDGAIPGKSYAYRLEATALGETWNYTTDIVSPAPIREGKYLSAITPNPFRTETVISYRVPRGWPLDQSAIDGKPGDDEGSITPPDVGEGAPRFEEGAPVEYEITRIEIAIFNVAGRLVKRYPDVHSYEGFYASPIRWDGTDDHGREVPQGVYFVRMKAGPITESRKVVLLK